MLSQRGRYALKALLFLARSTDAAPRQTSAIATAENIPRKFLEAILTEMVRHGLIQSVRGKYGGYRLARAPEAITFGEVVRLTDGPLALIPCVSKKFYQRCEDCTDEASCALRRVMAEVREQVASVLDSRTIADAVREGLDGDRAPPREAA